MGNWNIQELLEKKMKFLSPKDKLAQMTIIFSYHILYRKLEIQMLRLTVHIFKQVLNCNVILRAFILLFLTAI